MGNVPLGLCQCGCGQATRIATQTNTRYGWVKGQPRRFLQGHHRHLAKRPVEQRFWEKVDRGAGDECWVWTAARFQSSGYGLFNPGAPGGNIPVGAHRFAWQLTNGLIPEGQSVCHRCDNRVCVNPAHLFLGSAAENSADMVGKGRSRGPGAGERHPNAKLTLAAVQEIRARVAAGETQRALAEEYGVGGAQINRIVHNKRWSHV